MATSTETRQPDLSSLRIEDRSRKPRNAGKRLGLFAAAIGAMLLAGAAVLALRGRKPTVEVEVAAPAGDPRTEALLNASGYVTPRRRATIAAKITGRVTSVLFDEGMH